MTWDQKDQYKMENLNKVNSNGYMRVQICTTYKCQCVYSTDHLSPTIRCIGGGGLGDRHQKGERMTIRIRCNRSTRYEEAEPWDCIWLTFTESRHTNVAHGICGTVTTRPGELQVYVGRDAE